MRSDLWSEGYLCDGLPARQGYDRKDRGDRITQEIASFSSELGRIEENPEQAMGIEEPR